MGAIIQSAAALPRSKDVVTALKQIESNLFDEVDYQQLGDPLREYINDLQQELAAIHSLIAGNWFAGMEQSQQQAAG